MKKRRLAALVLALGAPAAGGPGMNEALQPENVAVVVNADSWASAALADAYVRLRGIPAGNVVTVRGLSSFEEIGIDEFRDRILAPVFTELDRRGLRERIDCLAYSADCPYAISFRGDLDGAASPAPVGEVGALTGLTYLHEAVLARAPQRYTALDSNFYAQRLYLPGTTALLSQAEAMALPEADQRKLRLDPPRRFRAATAWDAHGQPAAGAGGRRYLLSTMLGVTSGRGLSLAEAVAVLTRAAAADGTRPAGTMFYMVNDDIRTRTRRWGFDAAIQMLKEAGVAAVIEKGNLPGGSPDIAGAMVGSATFDLAASGGRIRPGAICEHLTSCGGIVKWGDNQTPLTEFLRHGAAGASGTVTEPYAIQAKFPDPFIHVHYARGASLAEAFYQSVAAPYQLLVVGDPLCRPWGDPGPSGAGAPARYELPAVAGPVAADNPAASNTVGRGFRVVGSNGVQAISGAADGRPWWQVAAVGADGGVTIEGCIEVRTNGIHQFQVRSGGEVRLTVSGQCLPATGGGPWRTYPVMLEAGWHSVSVAVKAGGGPAEVNFGAVGTPPLTSQLWCYPRPGDRVRHVGLSPRIVVPAMTDDPFALTLQCAVSGLQPTAGGTLAMRWDIPAGSGWAIEPACARTPVTNGVVEPFTFQVRYGGTPFRTPDFFQPGTCHLELQTRSGTEPVDSVGLPLELMLKERPRPRVRVARAVRPPKIDGHLTDEAWSGPAPITAFIRPGLDAPTEQPTAAWLAWDSRALYLAARCAEPALDRLRLAATQRDDPAYTDDSVELFVALAGEADRYYQVVVNAAGTIYDGVGYDASWNGDYEVATGREEAGWTVELAVPWSTFGVPPPEPGTILRVLVCRNRNAVSPGEATTWPAAPGGNHQPRLFAEAVLGGGD